MAGCQALRRFSRPVKSCAVLLPRPSRAPPLSSSLWLAASTPGTHGGARDHARHQRVGESAEQDDRDWLAAARSRRQPHQHRARPVKLAAHVGPGIRDGKRLIDVQGLGIAQTQCVLVRRERHPNRRLANASTVDEHFSTQRGAQPRDSRHATASPESSHILRPRQRRRTPGPMR